MDVWEYTAAYEIVRANQMLNGIRSTSEDDFENPLKAIKIDVADSTAAQRVDLTRTWATWRNDLAGTTALAITEAVMLQERTLSDIDATQRWRKGTAREHLAVGLKHFAALRGNVPRGAHDWYYKRPVAA